MSTELLGTINVPLARPHVGDDEVAIVIDVLESGQLCQGEITEQFETEFAAMVGAHHAIAVSSGSTALLIALQAMGVGVGDEVIVPDVTFVSTASAALYLGARPVFCDISRNDYCIDPAKIERLITAKTKVLVPVHFGGRTAPVLDVLDIAAKHGLLVLEDAAGAHLARSEAGYAGTLGDAGIFSFTPTKLMTTGEGGMITTNDDDLAGRCRKIRNFGDAEKFAWESLGFNFRMTALSAAVGLAQLKKLPDFAARRRALAARYTAAFARQPLLTTPPSAPAEANTFQLYPILVDVDALGITRDELIAELDQRGVASRLYYPTLHRMGVFADLPSRSDAEFPVAVDFERRSLCLPIFSDMAPQEQSHVIACVLDVIASRQN